MSDVLIQLHYEGSSTTVERNRDLKDRNAALPLSYIALRRMGVEFVSSSRLPSFFENPCNI